MDEWTSKNIFKTDEQMDVQKYFLTSICPSVLKFDDDQNHSMLLWANGPQDDDANDDDHQNYSMLLWANGPHSDDDDND